MRKIALLGSTGSIGTSTLDVVQHYPDRFQIVAMAAGSNIDLFERQILEAKPELVSIGSEELAKELKARLSGKYQVEIVWGMEGLIQVATHPEANFVMTGIMGSVGVRPTLAAIEAGKTIGLANKETLISAGKIVMETARKHNTTIIPVDSEHSAIFQAMQGENHDEISRLIITASGGSLRHLTREESKHVMREQALRHPNWSMGAKITIDSATMMNKGFEVIEAHWLFGIPYDQIDTLLHYESIIHSMVEYKDKAVMAQLGSPDMKVPIQYALTYPNRMSLQTETLDLAKCGTLTFKEMDVVRYPLLQLAYDCGRVGGSLPAVLNAANEVAVARFLRKEMSVVGIEELVHHVCEKHQVIYSPCLETIEEADVWARREAEAFSFE
ncbi:1-deoxy-D-xylulose-5-phosphate reductoisomerase [Brevibacillus daliensis]|uniref:1-deoxy-D-xylulose-5-phosphate reductoisomerase n=1 Tax=Brevibacillus daliensis TaxID=2892995 RepID=UPI001E481967|nr:1-deoxy-D-xylulose-5-phosphate reductoisomerase [Brevibacillus daliensis]